MSNDQSFYQLLSKIKGEKIGVSRLEAVGKQRSQLPIYTEEQSIVENINDNTVTIISGETESGKTTRLPQFLYEAGSLLQIRFEGNQTEKTKILFMTDGTGAVASNEKPCCETFYATPDFANTPARPLGFNGDAPTAPAVDIHKMRDEMIDRANRARAEYDEVMAKLKELEMKINGNQKTVHFEESTVEDEKPKVEKKSSVQPVVNQAASVYFGLPNDCVHFYNRQPEYHHVSQPTKNYDVVEAKSYESTATSADFEDQEAPPNTPVCYDSATSVYHFDSLRDQYNAYEDVQF